MFHCFHSVFGDPLLQLSNSSVSTGKKKKRKQQEQTKITTTTPPHEMCPSAQVQSNSSLG